MITDRCRRWESDLLALTRQKLRPFIGILTGHTQVQRHLSLMGFNNDLFCSYCDKAVESASHFLCHCNYFTFQCGENLSDSKGYCEVHEEISQILIKYPVTTGISKGTADGPTLFAKITHVVQSKYRLAWLVVFRQ